MNAGRMAALVVWGLVATAVAAEPVAQDEDLSKQSTGLLHARMTTEQKRLETAEQELTILRHELQKARVRQSEARAQKLDTSRVAPLLVKLQKDLTEVGDVVARGALPTKEAYQRLERSSGELSEVMTSAMAEFLPRPLAEERRTPLLEEIHGDPVEASLSTWTEFQVLRFPSSVGTTPATFAEQMKEAFSTSADRVKVLSVAELERMFARDQEQVVKVWQGIIDRAQAGIDARNLQVKDSQSSIDRLSAALDAREVQKFETDGRLTWAIIIMVIVLLLLYLATLLFKPEVQQTIFHQRILVEMIGMAFLLLTIIILGTGEKIDRAVLGTLLGTVGGYIFGQQQARRSAPSEAPSAQPTATQPVPVHQPAQPVAAQPAPVQPPVEQSAALMQQAAQQGAPAAAEALPPPAPVQLAARVQQAVEQAGALQPGAAVPAPLPPKEEPRENPAKPVA